MLQESARHVIIIGGGASGVILACHLLRDPTSDVRVTLIERRAEVGRGVAYCTAKPEHLLNVRAANMSAFPDQPEHFWRWLRGQKSVAAAAWGCNDDPFCFVPRRVYGDYIAGLIEPLTADNGRPGRLHIIQDECTLIGETRTGVQVALADGSYRAADVAVLATGHEAPVVRTGCYEDPWSTPADTDRNAAVLILGTGLTMVDYVLSLLLAGHTGPIVALSRRGLLPRAHRRTGPHRIDAADVPFGTNLVTLFRWFRHRVESHIAQGGDWRSVFDGVRPFSQQIWQRLPIASRRRFLEHARAWWDVHRHRMAPEVETRIIAAIATGGLTVIAGKICAIEQIESGALVRFRQRGQMAVETMHVGKIVECTGIAKDPRQTTNRALRSLFDQRLARVDPLGVGIDVTAECAVVNPFGVPSERIFAVGPLTRAAFWEIVAVPDIRNQCAELAARITRVKPAAMRALSFASL